MLVILCLNQIHLAQLKNQTNIIYQDTLFMLSKFPAPVLVDFDSETDGGKKVVGETVGEGEASRNKANGRCSDLAQLYIFSPLSKQLRAILKSCSQ